MSAVLTMQQEHQPARLRMRGALDALRKAWAAFTLERAIADVASMRDQDYRDFGLEKAEILSALRQLREECAANEYGLTNKRSPAAGSALAIRVNRKLQSFASGASGEPSARLGQGR